MSSGEPCAARLVVFSGDLSYSVRKNIVDLHRRLPGLQWLVVVHRPPRSLRQLARNQRLNLKKHGWRWLPYQALDLWRRWRTSPMASPPAEAPGSEYDLEQVEGVPGLEIRYFTDIHAPESLELVKRFGADLGLSLAAPILKPSLFALPRLGSINLHKGKLPDYRGMPPAFWELWTDQSAVGCSVHWVETKLDQGAVIAESSVARSRYSDVRGLQLSLDELGADLMSTAVQQLLEGRSTARRQVEGQGKTYRKPTLAQESTLDRRLANLAPLRTSPVRRAVQTLRAGAVSTADNRLFWRWLPPRVTVLLYHRVSDEVRDNLTVGIAQFERHMQLLRRHCDLRSIDQVIEMSDQALERRRRPMVSVTFDDGYRDNFEHAVPILRRYRVPAAFFVSTGIVSGNGRFPHDIRRGNPPIPLMSWDQLRQMQACGFTIGSHTVTHIDCAAEPEGKVVEELRQSRDDLARELGVSDPIFAYPYGGREHMTAQRLQLVKQAGYRACLSAYGGTNRWQVDRWNVLRRGLHWEFSDTAFLAECHAMR